MSDTKAFIIRLPIKIWSRLKDHTFDKKISMGKYIRDNLDKSLPKAKKSLNTKKKK